MNLQKTNRYFDANVTTLRNLMQRHGHEQIDLLKIDIEGAEYRVLHSLVTNALHVRVLCVEFDECENPMDCKSEARIKMSIESLLSGGFLMAYSWAQGNYTFVHKSVLP